MADLSQAQLEELVNGKPIAPRAMFYDQAELDHEESVQEGRRIYHKALYIKITAPGVTDWVAYRAQREDIAKYPDEYARYKATQQGVRPASVDIIPGLDILHLQELLDMGLATIPQLAAAQWVPDHLEYAREAARAIINVLRRTANGNQGQGNQQAQVREERLGSGANGSGGHWAGSPAPSRQIDSIDVGRHLAADCEGIDGGGADGLPGWDDEGGQVNVRGDGDHPAGTPPAGGTPAPTGSGRGVIPPGNVIDNWRVEFHWG
jgi:hypothetical protein